MNYYQALQNRKPLTKIPAGLTREYVVEAISGSSKRLLGPMPNVERIMLCHDRDDLRDILVLMDLSP